MSEKRQSGRPKKADTDKVKYQRIAVHAKDYQKLLAKLNENGTNLTDAFSEMVGHYCNK